MRTEPHNNKLKLIAGCGLNKTFYYGLFFWLSKIGKKILSEYHRKVMYYCNSIEKLLFSTL